MPTDNMQSAENSSKFKIQIFSQAFVYQRRTSPKKEMQMTQFGVAVEALNWYDEFECMQLAVNFNDLYIKEERVDIMLKELNESVKQSLRDKGLLV